MAVGRVNVGGGKSKLNVFTGLIEPKTKEGIWIKTDTKITKIINDLELWFADSWNDTVLKKYTDIPYSASNRKIVAVGTNIYVMGGYKGSAYIKTAYKYNTLTDTWTRLADVPFSITNDIYNSALVYVDGYLYMLTATGQNYKYNISTDTWTTLTSRSNNWHLVASAVGTNIFVFVTAGVNYVPSWYKYDTLTDTWTNLTNLGYISYITAVSHGTDIFILGLGSGDKPSAAMSRYDSLTHTITSLGTAPINAVGSAATLIGENIHYVSDTKHYIYNITNNTWTLLTASVPATMSGGNLVYANGSIIAFQGNDAVGNYRFNFTSKQYPNGTVIIYKQPYFGVYKTELITPKQGTFTGINSRLIIAFDNVYMYLNDKLNENLPTYYGDGTKWVKFKG